MVTRDIRLTVYHCGSGVSVAVATLGSLCSVGASQVSQQFAIATALSALAEQVVQASPTEVGDAR